MSTQELRFSADFESGNLGAAKRVSDCEYDVSIRTDTNNEKYALWFYFQVDNVAGCSGGRAGQIVFFNITNFSKTRSLYRDGMSPAVRSTSRPQWTRVPSKCCFYYKSNRQKRYCLTFAFAFDKAETFQFAYNFPYTYTQLQHELYTMEQRQLPFVRRSLIGRTLQHRRLDMLTITNGSNLEDKPVVFVTARVHPGESAASHVCQGLLQLLCSDSAEANALRDTLIFKVVPMLNPDGVFQGNYRCNSVGLDLNREWGAANESFSPTIHATRAQILRECNQTRVDFFIDLHAHSTGLNGFMLCNDMGDGLERQFPTLLSERSRTFSIQRTVSDSDQSKTGSGRRTMHDAINLEGKGLKSGFTHCYTLEASFFGWCDVKAAQRPIAFTIKEYERLGRDTALTFLDYYKIEVK